jgi:hypothetical protein
MTTQTMNGSNGNGAHNRLGGMFDQEPDPPPAKVDVVRSPARPSNQVLRSAALWAGRWLLGESDPLAGPLTLVMRSGDGSAEVRVRPTAEECEHPADPFAVTCPAAYFSTDERKIVAALAAGPLPLKVLTGRARLERSRCATLAGNLRDRGILRVGERGYELTAGPWAELAGR